MCFMIDQVALDADKISPADSGVICSKINKILGKVSIGMSMR